MLLATLEDEIDIIILVADGQALLPTDEAEAVAQSEQEAFYMGHERRFQITLGEGAVKPEEIQHIVDLAT